MESLRNIVSDIRIFLYGGLLTLPLTLAGTLSILGLFTANYAVLFFLVGFLIITPLASSILNFALGTLTAGTGYNPFRAKTGDVCKLVIPFTTLTPSANSSGSATEGTVVSSAYVSMMAFFIGYILTNGLELYNRQAEDTTLTVQTSSASDINSKVTNRKTQALLAIISTVVVAIIIFGMRYSSGCESMLGISLTSVIFGYMGYGWYKALSKVGQDRLSDLFGIANRLLPPSAITNAPIACVPVPA
jgi:hypothetical protein